MGSTPTIPTDAGLPNAVIPSIDGSGDVFLVENGAVAKFPYAIAAMVERSPMAAKEGLFLLGEKRTSVVALDASTGSVGLWL
jgi:hypothetical protein